MDANTTTHHDDLKCLYEPQSKHVVGVRRDSLGAIFIMFIVLCSNAMVPPWFAFQSSAVLLHYLHLCSLRPDG